MATLFLVHIKPAYEISAWWSKIVKEMDDSDGISMTPTWHEYYTGSGGTMHCESHSPIEKAGSGKCRWRRSNNRTLRTANSAYREAMANTPTDESRSCMLQLQFAIRFWLSLGICEIHSWYQNINFRIKAWPTDMAPNNSIMDVPSECSEVQKGDDHTRMKTNCYCNKLPYWKSCWDAPWSALPFLQ